MVVVESKGAGPIHERATYTLSHLGHNFYADCTEVFNRREVVLCHGNYYWDSDFDVINNNVKETRNRNEGYVKNVWRDPE